MDTKSLPLTEEGNPSTADLDLLGTQELLHRINDEDRRAAWAVEREISVIATAVDEIANRLRSGGKLHYFGAGTSGRIAVLDAAEIPPTFSTYDLVVAHIAGGHDAMARSVEAAEDDAAAGWREVGEAKITSADVVVGVSASGAAAYVLRALEAAKTAGALTICVTNSPDTALTRLAHIPIVLQTGPEVIAGSTRMKAGTAQKMTLTMLSTAVMVKLGKVYGNLMVDVHATNNKLRDRAERLTALISGSPLEAVRDALRESAYRVKTAVVMLRRNCNAQQADELLEKSEGNLRKVFSSEEPHR
ncbi:MAG TPA: N-acetylmuramic acid 6-phosphate etherase [Candidatus Acidoferrales bacterium]|nr:N-acetylmuramic acid 6-phosphate etherase [Candidatus Acidoferrales bacterium]